MAPRSPRRRLPRAIGAAAAVAVACAASGCAHWSRRSVEACALFEAPEVRTSVVSTPAAPAPELWTLKPHWIYEAVTSVEPVGDHFTVWYHDVEPAMVRVRVAREPNGKLALVSEGGWWGGPGAGPAAVSPPPPEVAPLARELEAELGRRCPGQHAWRVQYGGRTRTVRVQRFVALDVHRLRESRFGWVAHDTFSMDEGLTRVLGTHESWSGLGIINVPAGSAWVATAEPDGGVNRPFINPTEPALFEAARRYGTSAPPIDPATLVPADAPLFPPGYRSRVVLKVTVEGVGRTREILPLTEARLPLAVRDAVFGPGATAATTVEGRRLETRLHLTARLAPLSPRTPQSGLAVVPYQGTLTVRAEDDHGHSWQRDYLASGEIGVEGELAVAPAGFEVPGNSCPSPACTARSGVVPGDAPGDGISVRVEPGISDDRR